MTSVDKQDLVGESRNSSVPRRDLRAKKARTKLLLDVGNRVREVLCSGLVADLTGGVPSREGGVGVGCGET